MAFNLKINVHRKLDKKLIIMVLTVLVVLIGACKNNLPATVINYMISMFSDTNEQADLPAFTDCHESDNQLVSYTDGTVELMQCGTQYSIVNNGSLNLVYNIN